MKSLFTLALFIILGMVKTMGQEEACATPYSPDPYFDRTAYQKFEKKFLQKFQTRNNETIEIPIKINIVRHNDGTGGFDESLIEKTVDSLNARYEIANIVFNLCGGIDVIDRNEFYDFDRSLYQDELIAYNEPGVINVYFINKIFSSSSQICGYASFPWYDDAYVIVQNNCALNGSTFAHEVGHYLGLLHTHETSRGEELANGSNCIFSGDEICDTPADPRLGNSSVNGDCNYIGDHKDLNNEFYDPNPRNIMSYSRKSCRDEFSAGQVTRMRFYYERDRAEELDCMVVSTSTPNANTFLTLSPNPVLNQLSLNIAHPNIELQKIQIVNNLGQVVMTFHEPASTSASRSVKTIQVKNLPTGIYYLIAQTETQSQTLRFLRY